VGRALSIQPAVAQPADPATPDFRIALSDRDAALSLEAALDGAQRRLERPFCQKLLTDFADASGRPLRHNLEALGQTPESYMRLVLWVDGSKTAPCRKGSATAATMPGSRVVWVCSRRLVAHARADRRGVEIVLIHEFLHTLGLEENPPSSAAINVRVNYRCGAE
jgi:hypothetical protein